MMAARERDPMAKVLAPPLRNALENVIIIVIFIVSQDTFCNFSENPFVKIMHSTRHLSDI